MGGADPAEVERFQRVAAEQVAGDEAWRDGIEDEVAGPLLDWALRATDAAVARAASGAGADGTGCGTEPEAEPGSLEDTAWAVADQARALLQVVAGHRRGESWETTGAALDPLLAPPLFESAAAGAEAVAALLEAAL